MKLRCLKQKHRKKLKYFLREMMICCSLTAVLWLSPQLFVGPLPGVCQGSSAQRQYFSYFPWETRALPAVGRILSTFMCVTSPLTSCLYSLGLGEILPPTLPEKPGNQIMKRTEDNGRENLFYYLPNIHIFAIWKW